MKRSGHRIAFPTAYTLCAQGNKGRLCFLSPARQTVQDVRKGIRSRNTGRFLPATTVTEHTAPRKEDVRFPRSFAVHQRLHAHAAREGGVKRVTRQSDICARAAQVQTAQPRPHKPCPSAQTRACLETDQPSHDLSARDFETSLGASRTQSSWSTFPWTGTRAS